MLHAALIGAVCVAALSGPAQEGNPAKDLFDKMEAKLRGAKSLSFKCRSEQSGEGVGRGFVEGRVTLEGKTKARAQFRGFLNSEARKYELTSDGRQNKWFVSVFGDGGGPTPSSMNRNILSWLGRADLFNALYMGLGLEWAEVGLEAEKELQVSDFKMGKKGKVGKRDAQAVEFSLACKEAKLKYVVVLWIDTEKLVPLKKDIDVVGLGRFRETYTDYKIDAAIDPGQFTLPK